MCGMRAPGAESFRPLLKPMRHDAKRRHLFIGGFDRVMTTSVASREPLLGEGGRDRSGSSGALSVGFCGPVEGPDRTWPHCSSSSSYEVGVGSIVDFTLVT